MAAIRSTDLHAVADAHAREHGLISHCTDSYNDLMPDGLEQFLTQFSRIEQTVELVPPRTADGGAEGDLIQAVRYEVEFAHVNVEKPTTADPLNKKLRPQYPLDAIRLERTYAGETTVEITVRAEAIMADPSKQANAPKKETLSKRVTLGALPIMVGSRFCHTYELNPEAKLRLGMDPHDQGGYFLVQGREWCVDAVENHVFNQANIYRNVGHEKEVSRLEMISKPGDFYENSSEMIIVFTLQGQIQVQLTSCEDFKHKSPLQKSAFFPFFALFRLFGRSDKEIFDNVLLDSREANEVTEKMFTILKGAMYGASYDQFPGVGTLSGHELQEYLAEQLVRNWPLDKRRSELRGGEDRDRRDRRDIANLTARLPDRIHKFFLPHLGDRPEHIMNKLRHFGHLIHQLLLVKMEIVESADRDSLKNKRVHAAGQNLSKKLKQFTSRFVAVTIRNRMRKMLESTAFNSIDLQHAFRDLANRKLQTELQKEIVTSMRVKKADDDSKRRPLRTEELHRKNQLNTLNTLRVVRAPNMSASRKDDRARIMRYAHNSYPGFYCMLQTADTGEEVGIVKALGFNAFLSKASESGLIKTSLLVDPDILPFGRVFPSDIGRQQLTLIKVNGEIIGCCRNAFQIVRRYRELRRGFVSTVLVAAVTDGAPPPKQASMLDDLLAERFVPLSSGDKAPGYAARLPVLANVTIYWDTDSDEIHFWADQGRLLRPLLVVRNNGPLDPLGQVAVGWAFGYTLPEAARVPGKSDFQQRLMLTQEHLAALRAGGTISHLVETGIVDYIAPIEAENLLVAPSPESLAAHAARPAPYQFTHCEIPVSLMGLPALTCPYANHNQAPRITFQTNQSKQTCGWYALNWARRPDKLTFLQWSNELPLITTLANNYIYPNGQNAIVAITTAYLGNNQEDSLEANDTASQRGLFTGQHFNVVSRILDKETFATPLVEFRRQRVNYSHLHNGKVPIGTFVKQDDVLIGVTSPSGGDAQSVVYTAREDARVEDVINPDLPNARNYEDRDFCKVKYSNKRDFGIGQKFSSRHGQKGMTGAAHSQVDFYFTEDGLSPDLVMSTHAIPSRMTIGQLIESVDSIGAALLGRLYDRSVFTPVDLQDIGDTLVRCGWVRHGSRPMYSGRTGEFVDAEIFIGPTYYQRLQKYVEDEIYNADTSSIDLTTHQPREGKKVKGGLRMGEMEKDTIMANGCCLFLMENFRDNSDKYDFYVCRLCGQLANVNPDKGLVHCKRCAALQRTPDVYRVRSTWSSKLWIQELETAGVGVFLGLTPHVREDVGDSPFSGFAASAAPAPSAAAVAAAAVSTVPT